MPSQITLRHQDVVQITLRNLNTRCTYNTCINFMQSLPFLFHDAQFISYEAESNLFIVLTYLLYSME